MIISNFNDMTVAEVESINKILDVCFLVENGSIQSAFVEESETDGKN